MQCDQKKAIIVVFLFVDVATCPQLGLDQTEKNPCRKTQAPDAQALAYFLVLRACSVCGINISHLTKSERFPVLHAQPVQQWNEEGFWFHTRNWHVEWGS